MRLETGFFAQAADVVSDGRVFVHGGGIEGFAVPGTPIVIPSVAIVFRFQFLSKECGFAYPLRVTITDPNGADCGLNATSLLTPQIPSNFPDEGTRQFIAINIQNLIFTILGIYTVNVFVNESLLDSFSVGVAQSQQPIGEGQ
jgi:hypothetical protein